ncbi:hypothetical protein LguiA_014800 [Lonicera macranthoides]
MKQNLSDGGGISENSVHLVNGGNSESSGILVDDSASETIIVMKLDEEHDEDSVHRVNESLKGLNKVVEEKDCCVIDVKCGSNFDGEMVCRICHLSSDKSVETSTAINERDLIPIGCGCKGELGIAHSHCAEAWFKLKGNRFCEICGETAKSITGVGDDRFMEEWNENRSSSGIISSGRSEGCWRRQPFCNFLMACLVIAFVVPWFFRVSMF